jgi:hypothetical protein
MHIVINAIAFTRLFCCGFQQKLWITCAKDEDVTHVPVDFIRFYVINEE